MYAYEVVDVAVEDFMQRYAPDDVRTTVRWLVDIGYELALSQIGASDWDASFVYAGEAEVHVGVERSQWYLDIAPAPGMQPIQYDLLVAAQRGHNYWDCFPRWALTRPDTLGNCPLVLAGATLCRRCWRGSAVRTSLRQLPGLGISGTSGCGRNPIRLSSYGGPGAPKDYACPVDVSPRRDQRLFRKLGARLAA